MTVSVFNPYTQQKIGDVPLCSVKEVEVACETAWACFRNRSFSLADRQAVLVEAAQILAQRSDFFADCIMQESGKPITAARSEVQRAVDTFRLAADCVMPMMGSRFEIPSEADHLAYYVREPLGLLAAITPFNFPLNLVAHKVAPAIAAGCPVLLKPAPQTPFTALNLLALLRELGLPDGWFQVLTDSGTEAAIPLVRHSRVSVISFTGSVTVGWDIKAAVPEKKVLLELGSNSPVIIDRDADLEVAAQKIRRGGFGYAGQTCISVQRVLVHEAVYDAFMARLRDQVSDIRVGDPAQSDTEVGPMIRVSDRDRVLAWIQEAVDLGGTLLCGGTVCNDGCLIPAIVADVPLASRLWESEVFGPVVAVRKVADFAEALSLANASTIRIHAGVFTENTNHVEQAIEKLQFGGVLVNEVPTFRLDAQPYGGVGLAGNTREGPLFAIEEITTTKCVIHNKRAV